MATFRAFSESESESELFFSQTLFLIFEKPQGRLPFAPLVTSLLKKSTFSHY